MLCYVVLYFVETSNSDVTLDSQGHVSLAYITWVTRLLLMHVQYWIRHEVITMQNELLLCAINLKFCQACGARRKIENHGGGFQDFAKAPKRRKCHLLSKS